MAALDWSDYDTTCSGEYADPTRARLMINYQKASRSEHAAYVRNDYSTVI